MTNLPLSAAAAVTTLLLLISAADSLGSGATLAACSSGSICGLATNPSQNILCHSPRRPNQTNLSLFPNVSFSALSGGATSLCALRSGGAALLCWDNPSSSNSTLAAAPHRLYFSPSAALETISVGDSHVCATLSSTSAVICWRYDRYRNFSLPSGSERFDSISSGSGYSCGILTQTSRVRCWGSGSLPNRIQSGFANTSMLSIVSGGSHSCGLNQTGFLVCRGNNESGQINPPIGSAFEFSQISLGLNHSCAIRASNGSVVCWGGDGEFGSGSAVAPNDDVSFELIVSGSGFTCGLTTLNFSVVCWGPGWLDVNGSAAVPLPEILPGPCVVESSCGNCSTYPLSQTLCSGQGRRICKPCFSKAPGFVQPPPVFVPVPVLVPSPVRPPSRGLRKGLLAFAITGAVGGFAGICAAAYCLWTGVCFGKKKIHSSVQPTITRAGSSNNGGGASSNSPSSTIRRNGSRIMRRQRSGTSSKHADRAEEFTLAELAAATDGFSPENKVGAGSFGAVYRGKLADGREVAIKRGESGGEAAAAAKKHREKENAFESELAFLSRLHHKHLVRLVGYCEEEEERLLVYEFMKNGALYDHLHGKANVEKVSDAVNSWKTRIKIALDAARGIEYLHSYAVPPIIHRDIKSSNILLDATWTAKVSDLGLSLTGTDFRPSKAAGTVGYIDPEYYGLNMLTAKSDVYGLGVVLLELLTGKRAIFRTSEDGGGGAATSVVDFAVPAIMAGELASVLDRRVGPPELNEGEAVELVAYTAMHCVNLEGRERPTMTDIVANLERALSLCDDSHGSISSGIISIVSE